MIYFLPWCVFSLLVNALELLYIIFLSSSTFSLTPPGSKGSAGAGVQSISASDLLKQQKQQQKQLLENRRRRAEEIQQRVLQNTGRAGVPGASPPSRGTLLSPKSASEVPKVTQSPTAPQTPTLGRGFNEGDDILFFDHTPPPPPTPHSLSAAKVGGAHPIACFHA